MAIRSREVMLPLYSYEIPPSTAVSSSGVFVTVKTWSCWRVLRRDMKIIGFPIVKMG